MRRQRLWSKRYFVHEFALPTLGNFQFCAVGKNYGTSFAFDVSLDPVHVDDRAVMYPAKIGLTQSVFVGADISGRDDRRFVGEIKDRIGTFRLTPQNVQGAVTNMISKSRKDSLRNRSKPVPSAILISTKTSCGFMAPLIVDSRNAFVCRYPGRIFVKGNMFT